MRARGANERVGASQGERVSVAQRARQSVRTAKTILNGGTARSVLSVERYEVESLGVLEAKKWVK